MDKFTNSFARVGPNKPSPVRIRREIVAGAYGKVKVEVGLTNDVIIRCDDVYTAESLREAAHIFNQIAEALEDNEK
jgi:hypothetical protein